jgi:hypothetical protein
LGRFDRRLDHAVELRSINEADATHLFLGDEFG